MKFNLRRRDIILIVGFWLVGCALLSVIFYFVVFPSAPSPPKNRVIAPQATYTLAYTQVTAKSMQPATQSKLAQWATDAKLFAVAATWDKTQLEAVGQPTTWTYRYYSPSQRRFYFVTVNPNGEVTGTSHGERIYNAPQRISVEDWKVDSSEAVNTWLNYGGAAMLSAMPGIQVVAQLQISEPTAPLTWAVAGYDRISKHYHTVFIDARTGKVTQIVSSLTQQK